MFCAVLRYPWPDDMVVWQYGSFGAVSEGVFGLRDDFAFEQNLSAAFPHLPHFGHGIWRGAA